MAKELPYFRFTVSEWLNDDISLESYELKGLFIDVCSFYWFKDCSINIAMLEKKFINALTLVNQLVKLEIIKVNNKGDVNIMFLDAQYDLLSEKRKRRQTAGSKGGKSKASNAKAMLKQNPSYKDKDNNNKKDNKKDNIPEFSLFLSHAKSKIDNVSELAVRLKYDAWIENDWKDGNDSQIKNWKSKLTNTVQYLETEKPKQYNGIL